MVNKLNSFFSLLANNEAFYKQLVDAVQSEMIEARQVMQSAAVNALYHPEENARACGLCGQYEVWCDILSRLTRAQKQGAGNE